MNNLENMINQISNLLDELKYAKQLHYKYDTLRIEKGKYQAYFYGNTKLAELLRDVEFSNNHYLYDIVLDPKYKFKTLEDLLEEGKITREEYNSI